MDSLTRPLSRRVAVVPFGAKAQALVEETVQGHTTMFACSAATAADGQTVCDLIVIIADNDSLCPDIGRLSDRARKDCITMLAVVLDAPGGAASGPAAATLRGVADTIVLTTDDELFALMARWLERAD